MSGFPTDIRVLMLAAICGLAAVGYCGQITPSPDWKNSIEIPDDPFERRDVTFTALGWVKFTILTEPYDPNIVYFQDSNKYLLHYDFAVERVDPFLGMSPNDFEQVTLYAMGQQAILGTVITPPMLPRQNQSDPIAPVAYEYGIQFVRADPYSREEVAEMFEVVRSSIEADPNYQALYMPTYEQQSVAEASRDWLLQRGIVVSSPMRWLTSNVCYSSGWVLGRLKYVATEEIETAYASGRLRPSDILLTDAIPAELPVVAGIMSLTPSTPNSHVAILAKTYSIPFAYLALEEDVEKAQQFVDEQIVFSAYEDREVTKIQLVNVDEALNEQQKEELLALKAPPALNIVATERYGAYSAAVDDLDVNDIRYFGGKAANYSILRGAIGGNCRIATAFSFDLWNDFLDQQLYPGTTLRQFIAARLDGVTYPPADMASVLYELNWIRAVIRDADLVQFTPAMQQAVIDTLTDSRYGFDQYRKIRFRSSTNVEDSEHFTGAGLYDSYSGCLADELDGDDAGPSQCDPDKNNERGVFRAIRRVFASFYNDNAYLERLRHGINEDDVGMAVLVHHSFPDEIELGNGVATLEVRETGPSRYMTDIRLVTQDGAVSVANPDPGVVPEEVTVSRSLPTEPIYPRLRVSSNLIPLGSTVMDWTGDYVQLCELLLDAEAEFRRVSGKSEYILDFEYKKVSTGEGLVVKQIREIPRSADSGVMTAMLINEPTCFCLYQGEYGSVFGYHRLKSVWQMQTRSLWLSEENLAGSLLSHVDLEYLAGGRIRSVGGSPESWPYASHIYEITGPGRAKVNDGWLMHHLSNPRQIEIEMEGMPIEVSDSDSPVVTLEDFAWYGWPHMTLRVEYDKPEPEYDYHTWPDSLGQTNVDLVGLWPCPRTRSDDRLQQRVLSDNDKGIRIETSFYWPMGPGDDPAGYTAPLVRWVQTKITGLTSQPITLHGEYSQTYLPGHHNILEFFVFEPQLEDGIDPEIVEELRAKDACVIFALGPRDEHGVIVGPIGTYRFEDEPFLAADADGDDDVDWKDYTVVGERWLDVRCDECGGADLTGDGQVGFSDVCEFALEWLGSLE